MRRLSVLLVPMLIGAAACSSDEASGDVTVVIGTDTECKPAKTDFAAGKQTFEIKNEGSKATELYVYQGDTVVSEVENVGPGTSRKLTVDLKEGDYDLGCKPGQTGDAIRAPIEVTGAGGSQGGPTVPADREAAVQGVDYAFTRLESFSGKAGETVKFKLENKAPTQQHEFELFEPGGTAIGEIEPVDAGKSGEANFTLTKTGTYTYVCGVEDATGKHEEKGMKGTFTVS